jgi:hypothetical protein
MVLVMQSLTGSERRLEEWGSRERTAALDEG